MKKSKQLTLFTFILLSSIFSQVVVSDTLAPIGCKVWKDTAKFWGPNTYIRWERVPEHILPSRDYKFKAHGSRNLGKQARIYFYNEEDSYVGSDRISVRNGDAKIRYNFSKLGTQDIWIERHEKEGSNSYTLCAKTKVHVQFQPTLSSAYTDYWQLSVGDTARLFASGGGMSEYSKYSLQNKPLEYRWIIFNADTAKMIGNLTTTTPYKKFVFDYGGEYIVSVATFDGTFLSETHQIEISILGKTSPLPPGEYDIR